MKKQVLVLLVLIVALVGIFVISPSLVKKEDTKAQISPTITVVSEVNKTFTYEGKTGIDALTLLKEKTIIKQDDSGLVTSISEKDADSSKREYWSFYVNGKMASVGPADYITKNEDKIEWKLKSY